MHSAGNENQENTALETFYYALKEYEDYFNEPFELKSKPWNMAPRTLFNFAWFLKFCVLMAKAEAKQKRGELKVIAQ